MEIVQGFQKTRDRVPKVVQAFQEETNSRQGRPQDELGLHKRSELLVDSGPLKEVMREPKLSAKIPRVKKKREVNLKGR